MYKTRISSDYFTAQGLETRTGLSRNNWSVALIKELIDNALDAIEPNTTKEITIEYSYGTLNIFDNGPGLNIADVKAIYDFEYYVSKNRHIINISRGKQGNGLKSVIGICQIKRYKMLWHTNENIIIHPVMDTENAQDSEIDVLFNHQEETELRGVEIHGLYDIDVYKLDGIISEYVECNRDVKFYVNVKCYEPSAESVDKQAETSLLFYDFKEFQRLINVQEPSTYYKSFLGDVFGTRIKNASKITGKIKDVDMDDVKRDFNKLQALQDKKPLTLLRKHLIGYKNVIEQYPYIIEFEAFKCDEPGALVMVNNSITYRNASSIAIRNTYYAITPNKKVYASHLSDIVNAFDNYVFKIHIITPRPTFRDYGKTVLELDAISIELVDAIRKAVNREKRKQPSTTKPPSQKELAFRYMRDAYKHQSSNGKNDVTARQVYYRLREMIRNNVDPDWETSSTYRSFTQEWLTDWFDENPEYEDKIHFNDRGIFIVDGKSIGLGTANVLDFLTDNNASSNIISISANISTSVSQDINIGYRYDKALYVEKTGFNTLFQAEGLQEKHNMIIVSGQGFGTRAARRLLYDMHQCGLTIYCLHDLDIHGMGIIDKLRNANKKFPHDIPIVDLGITPDDVERYGITPEIVGADFKPSVLNDFSSEHYSFFLPDNGNTRRVELNAFTTAQLLEIINDKLTGVCTLPTLDISDVMDVNLTKFKELALYKLVRSKYSKMLSGITIADMPTGRMTYHELIRQLPTIENKMMLQIERSMDTINL